MTLAKPRRALILTCALAPLLEAGLVASVGPRSALSLAPQLTAPPPFDVFHDLRWIALYHNSWMTLGLELGAMIFLRSAFTAWVVWLAGGRDRSFLSGLGRAVSFYLVVTVLMVPWVVLIFGFGIIGLSYLFIVALPAVIALGLIVHRGGAAHASGAMWQWRPTWSSCRWLGAAFLWLTIAGAVASAGSLGVAFVAVSLAGALNAVAAWAIARDVVDSSSRPRRRQYIVPLGVAGVLAVVLLGGAVVFAAGTPHGTDRTRIPLPRHATGRPVLVAGGFATRWRGAPQLRLPHGFVEWRFSYRGIDDRGRLLPYGPRDTLRPLAALTEVMDREVDALHAAYGEPVTIVAESEGALIARAYLLADGEAGSGAVDRLITLDMPTVGAGVYYPPAGASGWGWGAGWGLRGLTAVVGNIGFVRVSADAPFFRSLLGCPALRAAIGTKSLPPGIEETRVIALADAVDDYMDDPRVASYVIRSPHGGLIGRAEVQALIARTISGRGAAPPGAGLPLVRLIGRLAAPWSLPGLKDGLAPVESC